MKHSRHIIVSPHRDDACFSLAITIGILGGGNLINIFSRSQYVADISLLARTPSLTTEEITIIRDREDKEFCEIMNLQRYELGFPEAPLRGLPWNITNDEEYKGEEQRQAQMIIGGLEDLVVQLSREAEQATTTIFLPMAIGSHRDHMATLIAGNMLRKRLPKENHKWLYYEDLPYASWEGTREGGIKRFKSIVNPKTLRKLSLRLTPAQLKQKIKLVNIYSSQHPASPRLENFMGTDSWAIGPHEGLWEIEEYN